MIGKLAAFTGDIWEMTLPDKTQVPTEEHLLRFLFERVHSLESNAAF